MRTVTVNWIAPIQRADDTALPVAQIQRFKVYASLNAGPYDFLSEVVDEAATSLITPALSQGTYNFKVTAIDTNNQESVLSPGSNAVVVPVDLPAPPKAPNNVSATLN